MSGSGNNNSTDDWNKDKNDNANHENGISDESKTSEKTIPKQKHNCNKTKNNMQTQQH
jgi:hypothetical protein